MITAISNNKKWTSNLNLKNNNTNINFNKSQTISKSNLPLDEFLDSKQSAQIAFKGNLTKLGESLVGGEIIKLSRKIGNLVQESVDTTRIAFRKLGGQDELPFVEKPFVTPAETPAQKAVADAVKLKNTKALNSRNPNLPQDRYRIEKDNQEIIDTQKAAEKKAADAIIETKKKAEAKLAEEAKKKKETSFKGEEDDAQNPDQANADNIDDLNKIDDINDVENTDFNDNNLPNPFNKAANIDDISFSSFDKDMDLNTVGSDLDLEFNHDLDLDPNFDHDFEFGNNWNHDLDFDLNIDHDVDFDPTDLG